MELYKTLIDEADDMKYRLDGGYSFAIIKATLIEKLSLYDDPHKFMFYFLDALQEIWDESDNNSEYWSEQIKSIYDEYIERNTQ